MSHGPVEPTPLRLAGPSNWPSGQFAALGPTLAPADLPELRGAAWPLMLGQMSPGVGHRALNETASSNLFRCSVWVPVQKKEEVVSPPKTQQPQIKPWKYGSFLDGILLRGAGGGGGGCVVLNIGSRENP